MEEVDNAFNYWISQFPESYHSLDKERYFGFIDAVAASGEYLDEAWLKSKIDEADHKMGEEQVASILASYTDMVEYAQYKMKRR